MLDYALVGKEMEEHIKRFTIYEGNKDISPFNLRRTGGEVRMVYSDHNPMVLETDLVMKEIKSEEENQSTMGGREEHARNLYRLVQRSHGR